MENVVFYSPKRTQDIWLRYKSICKYSSGNINDGHNLRNVRCDLTLYREFKCNACLLHYILTVSSL